MSRMEKGLVGLAVLVWLAVALAMIVSGGQP